MQLFYAHKPVIVHFTAEYVVNQIIYLSLFIFTDT